MNFPAEIGQSTLLELFELSFDPMCIIRRGGEFVLVNEALRKMLGLTQEALSNRSLLDFVHEDEMQLVTTSIDAAYETQTVQMIAFRLICAGTTPLWFLWKFHPKADQLIYAVAKDITPFQQLETVEQARLQFAEALLDTVLLINNNDLTLDNVLPRILANIGKVVSFSHVNIMLIEGSMAVMAAAYTAGEQSRDVAGDIATYQAGIPRPAVSLDTHHYLTSMNENKRPVIVNDIAHDEHWTPLPDIDAVGSYLGSPVMIDGEVIAFINVTQVESHYYTAVHARQLMMFANHVAIAIKHAYLFEQADVAAALNERQRLARELHDSVNQILFSAGTYARLIPQVMHTSPDKVTDYAGKISQHIRGALAQMRTILAELQPENLTNTDFSLLLKQLSNAFTGTSGLPVSLNAANHVHLTNDVQITYYRIAQEALHNIEKHANASEVTIHFFEQDHTVTLIIEDNGAGFDPDTPFLSSFGLKNMRERAAAVGAELVIESDIQKGTRIILVGKDHHGKPTDSRHARG